MNDTSYNSNGRWFRRRHITQKETTMITYLMLTAVGLLFGMSLIKTGGGVAAISGKTGGTVFARNKAGAYARNWAKPVNPGSSRQTDVRSNFAGGSAAFSMLTTSQVAAWAAYAAGLTRVNRQGDSYTPTGRQIYIEQYNNMTAVAQTPLETPSAISNVPAITSLGAIVAESDGGELGAVTMAAPVVVIPSGSDGVLIVEAAPSHKASVTNVNTQFRQIYTGSAHDAANLAPGFIAVFGNNMVTGQTFSVRVRVIDETSGLGSTRILADTEIVNA